MSSKRSKRKKDTKTYPKVEFYTLVNPEGSMEIRVPVNSRIGGVDSLKEKGWTIKK